MPRKRYYRDENDPILNAFVNRMDTMRDWRQFLAQAGYTQYRIDQYMQGIKSNGLAKIVTLKSGDMLVEGEVLVEWLKGQGPPKKKKKKR